MSMYETFRIYSGQLYGVFDAVELIARSKQECLPTVEEMEDFEGINHARQLFVNDEQVGIACHRHLVAIKNKRRSMPRNLTDC